MEKCVVGFILSIMARIGDGSEVEQIFFFYFCSMLLLEMIYDT